MSEDKAAEAPAAAPPGPAGPSKLPMIIGLLNTVVVLAALGFLVYSKLLFKRPAITESDERQRLAELQAKTPVATVQTLVTFEPFTVNIRPVPGRPRADAASSRQLQGKLHYATIGFSLEIRDENKKDLLEEVRPVFLDQVIGLLGKKDFNELTTAQGRYIIRTELLEIANQLVGEPLVTNVFFSQFIVQ